MDAVRKPTVKWRREHEIVCSILYKRDIQSIMLVPKRRYSLFLSCGEGGGDQRRLHLGKRWLIRLGTC